MENETFTEAYRLVERLKDAPDKAAVAEIMKGASGRAFVLIDEKPGLFDPRPYDGNWFAWLRQLRNSPDSGLFDNFV